MALPQPYEPDIRALLERVAAPLRTPQDLDPLLDAIGDARFVLIGEASHGTAEFYLWRIRLSQRLIREKEFSFVAVEGDWPDCYQVNRYVKGYPDAGNSAREVLHAFARWPTWMWANWEVTAFCEWLHRYNVEHQASVGFYGLDVYSLWESMEHIIHYLEEHDPEAIPLAKAAYRCFEPYGESEQAYAYSTRMVGENCREEVVNLLRELRKRVRSYDHDRELSFSTEQNALVMVDAERYYRTMIQSDASSWNIRDEHMTDTLERLMHLHGLGSKAIVWAHNTHIGDARATDMARHGMVNIGQLVRQRHGEDETMLVGFSTHHGQVIAGREWGAPMERMNVPPASRTSWDATLHESDPLDTLYLLRDLPHTAETARQYSQRAIGVVYDPAYEQFGNYVPTVLPARYDALMHIESTGALHPLHWPHPEEAGTPDTYPWGV